MFREASPELQTVPRSVLRLRLALACLGLGVLVFSQSPGLPAADTKLDLLVSPGRFLRAAMSMWNPVAGAGELQDQAYGYLFPMGPFFLLAKLAALPPWVIQRTWESGVVIVAFLGMFRLARLLGVAGFAPRIAAALSYALAPRMVMELGVISSELLPMALLPWLLIPLVRATSDGSVRPRRAAARSGMALLCVGGINASAALAVLPVPLLWLLTRQRGARRRALLGWWIGSVVAASLWWAIPLLVLGKYSPPFLDWIESSSTTTSVTDLTDTLRGNDHWLAFLGPGTWPAGWLYVAAPAVVLATAAVAALGLAGLGGRRTPHRGFLLVTLVLGIGLATAGHVAGIGPAAAGSVRHLLDGPLNAFRNVHKFDPVLRLPLAIGLGHAVARLLAALPSRRSITVRGDTGTLYPRATVLLALAALAVVACVPVIDGRVVPQTRLVDDATWWTQAGNWLGQHAGGGRALVVPGAAQPVYFWGAPTDDALQPVADGPWLVRNNLPLMQPGLVRLLDTVESTLASGRAEPSLAPLLARSGVRYLVVRNDLDAVASISTPLRYVHATLDNSPGWRQAAGFGPELPPVGNDPNRLYDLGLTRPRSAVQIFENPAWSGQAAQLMPVRGSVVAYGAADALPQVLAAGTGSDTPVFFGGRPAALAGLPTETVLTDGVPKREFELGRIASYSPLMTAGQGYQQQRPAHDFLPPGTGPLSTVTYRGITGVRASTSGSDLGIFYTSTADAPWSAVDGDPGTAWRSAPDTPPTGQWLDLSLDRSRYFATAEIAFAPLLNGYPSRIRVTTDAGSLDQDVRSDAGLQTIKGVPGPTSSVRITVLAVTHEEAVGRVGIATLRLPGVAISRSLSVPAAGTPDVISFRTMPGQRSSCLTVAGAAACEPAWAQNGEDDGALDRTFGLSAAGRYSVTGHVRMAPGPRLDALLDAGNPLQAVASSVDAQDPRERPGAAVDGDPTTGWVAAAGDRQASLQVRLPTPRPVEAVTVEPIRNAPVAAPTRVRVQAGPVTVTASLTHGDTIRLPRVVRTAAVRITVLAASLRVSTDSVTGAARLLPVGIGEVRLRGVEVPVARPASSVSLDCTSPSPLTADGTAVPVRLQAAAATVLAGDPVDVTGCRPVELAAGRHELRLLGDGIVSPLALVLAQHATVPSVSNDSGTMSVERWTPTSRSVRVTAEQASVLVVHENANAGWQARLGGRTLRPLTVDGWQQGWLLPAGSTGTVQLRFRPQRTVGLGLVIGALAVVLLLVAACWRPRHPATGVGIGEARTPKPVVETLAVLGMTAIGGPFGAVSYLGVRLLVAVLASRERWLPSWLPAAVCLGCGLVAAWAAGHSSFAAAGSAPLQAAQLVGLGALVAGAIHRPAPAQAVPLEQRAFEQVP